MRTIEVKVYKINEHPNKIDCFNWMRNNFNDLNDYSVKEMEQSIKALSSKIGGTYNYSFGESSFFGEYITFSNFSRVLLETLISDELPLTGVCWDQNIIECLIGGDPSMALKSLHSDTNYKYSDAGLTEMCDCQDFEFMEDGSLFS